MITWPIAVFFIVLLATLGSTSASFGLTKGRAQATCYAAGLDYVTVTSDGKTAVCGTSPTERRALPIPQSPKESK